MLTRTQRREGLFAIGKLRRGYGITLMDALCAVRELKAEGILDRGCDRAEAADLVISHILAAKPELSVQVGFDWESLIELFLQLLPLILALFGL